MPLSNNDKINLCDVASEHWLSSQAALFAYRRNFEQNRRISKWLSRATLIAAFATAATASINGLAAFYHAQASGPLKWVAAGSSLLTAAIAAIDQNFAPRAHSQAFWDCKAKLEGIKRELISWAVLIESFDDVQTARVPLDQISSRIDDATKEPVDTDPKDRDLAEEEFVDTALWKIRGRYQPAPQPPSFAATEALSFDAPGIIAVNSPLTQGPSP